MRLRTRLLLLVVATAARAIDHAGITSARAGGFLTKLVVDYGGYHAQGLYGRESEHE